MQPTNAFPDAKTGSSLITASRGSGGWLRDATLGTYEKELRLRQKLAKADANECSSLYRDLLEMPDTPERAARVELLIDRWAQIAPEAALPVLEEVPDHVGLLFEAWGRHDASAALSAIGQVNPGPSLAASAGLFRSLARREPRQALIRLGLHGHHSQEDVRTAYQQMVKEDIDAALSFFDKESTFLRRSHAGAITSTWAETEPEAALRFARSLEGREKRSAFEGILETWRPEDLDVLGALVQEANEIGSDGSRNQVSAAGKEVAIDLAESHGAEAAIDWAKTYLPELPRRYFYVEMIQDSLDQGAEAVSAWLGTIEEGPFRHEVVEEFVRRRDHPREHLETMIEVLEAEPEAWGQEALEQMLRGVRAYPDIVERHLLNNQTNTAP